MHKPTPPRGPTRTRRNKEVAWAWVPAGAMIAAVWGLYVMLAVFDVDLPPF